MENKYKVKRLTNRKGDSHLVVVAEEAVEDQFISSVLIIPYAEGFIDPVAVKLKLNKKGVPKTANNKFGIVLKYIYE